MINEFIDYDLEPSAAWAKHYTDTTIRGEVEITYGVQLLANLTRGTHEFNYWARAVIKPEDRYFPIFIEQRYNYDVRALFRDLYSDIRCAVQS